MASLKLLFIGLLIAAHGTAEADPVDRWAVHITEASRRFRIPEPWIRRVMRLESGGQLIMNGRPIVSRAGAIGLMQLMPETWRDMRELLGLGTDPADPHDNILAGAAYLRLMYHRFGYPGLFAAYNAGPTRYTAFLATGRPLPAETLAYVTQAIGQDRSAQLFTRQSEPILFAIGRSGKATHGANTNAFQGPGAIFVELGGSVAASVSRGSQNGAEPSTMPAGD